MTYSAWVPTKLLETMITNLVRSLDKMIQCGKMHNPTPLCSWQGRSSLLCPMKWQPQPASNLTPALSISKPRSFSSCGSPPGQVHCFLARPCLEKIPRKDSPSLNTEEGVAKELTFTRKAFNGNGPGGEAAA